MEEAIFLAKFGSKVTVVQPPRRVPRLGDHGRPRAGTDNLEFLTPYVVEKFLRRGRQALEVTHAAQHRDRRDARARGGRVHRDRPRAAVRARRRASSTPTRTATSSPRASRPARTCRACSRPATWSTTRTARPSPPPARAVRPRWTPSGTCATTRWCRRPTALAETGDLAEEQWGAAERAGLGGSALGSGWSAGLIALRPR